tara:strand:+ start:70 stop:300 length:231 start_codon:yes stop_codon:yes gene_type:complete
MAITQTSADKKSVGMVTQEDGDGFVYTMLGAVRFYTGSGTPANDMDGVGKGDLCADTNGGKLWCHSGTAWVDCTVA